MKATQLILFFFIIFIETQVHGQTPWNQGEINNESLPNPSPNNKDSYPINIELINNSESSTNLQTIKKAVYKVFYIEQLRVENINIIRENIGVLINNISDLEEKENEYVYMLFQHGNEIDINNVNNAQINDIVGPIFITPYFESQNNIVTGTQNDYTSLPLYSLTKTVGNNPMSFGQFKTIDSPLLIGARLLKIKLPNDLRKENIYLAGWSLQQNPNDMGYAVVNKGVKALLNVNIPLLYETTFLSHEDDSEFGGYVNLIPNRLNTIDRYQWPWSIDYEDDAIIFDKSLNNKISKVVGRTFSMYDRAVEQVKYSQIIGPLDFRWHLTYKNSIAKNSYYNNIPGRYYHKPRYTLLPDDPNGMKTLPNSFSIGPGETKIVNHKVNKSRLFRIIHNNNIMPVAEFVASGIKLTNPQQNLTGSLYLALVSEQNNNNHYDLYYGTTYDNDMQNLDQDGFGSKTWPNALNAIPNVTINTLNMNNGVLPLISTADSNLSIIALKNKILQNIHNQANIFPRHVLRLRQNLSLHLDTKLILHNSSNQDIDIEALDVPDGWQPVSAFEKFNPDFSRFNVDLPLYPKSSGQYATWGSGVPIHDPNNGLFINNVQFNSLIAEKIIETGNNGGYLDLDNPHYQIEMVASLPFFSIFHQIRLNLRLSDILPKQVSAYNIWIDYNNDFNFQIDEKLQNIDPDDQNTHETIFFKFYTKTWAEITNNSDEDYVLKRMRISVKYPLFDATLEPEELFDYGEVEDFLVKLYNPNKIYEIPANLALLNLNFGDLTGEDDNDFDNQCPPNNPDDDQEVDCPVKKKAKLNSGDLPKNQNQINKDLIVFDKSYPTSCKLDSFNSISSNEVFDNVIVYHQNTHSYVNATTVDTYIDGGCELNGKAFQNIFVNATLNIPNDSSIASGHLFEYGSTSTSGLTLTFDANNKSLSFNIKSDTNASVASISYTLPDEIISADCPFKVTAAFFNSTLQLYVNNNLVSSGTTTFQEIVAIPDAEVGIGGTNGTDILANSSPSTNLVAYIHEMSVMANITEKGVTNISDFIQFYVSQPNPYTCAQNKGLSQNNGDMKEILPENLIINPEQLEENLKETDLKIFPNPNSGSFNIIYQKRESGTLIVRVFNMQAKEVYNKTDTLNKGHHLMQFNLQEHLAKGTYVIKIFDSNGIASGKLIIK